MDDAVTNTNSISNPQDQNVNYQSLLKFSILSESSNPRLVSTRALSYTSPSKNPKYSYDFPSMEQPHIRRYHQTPRKISKSPFKVLDAPLLQDDFYLNLLDWSSLNVIAVGLGSEVYLRSSCNNKVELLCDLNSYHNETVTSVKWSNDGNFLAVGTGGGEVQIWDSIRQEKIRCIAKHDGRVGSLDWNCDLVASGSRDNSVFVSDMRCASEIIKFHGHKQEVCGLRWSPNQKTLASGGNDNKLLIWDVAKSSEPCMKFGHHTAAVKALAWSPHERGLLSSGGGTADRCIRFWNTLTGEQINSIDTDSQVCNLIWSQNVNELVSTHGYSLNHIVVWKYPSMSKVATLTGHTYRVLYLSISPDGQTIVTGAGDETLRFWNVFPMSKSKLVNLITFVF